MSALIQLKNLTKQYGKKIVLKKINLDINQGEILGIIGMSGSGKTTLLNTLIGFLEPEEGDVLYKNKKQKKYTSIFKNSLKVRNRFGFATQVPSFYPRLTIAENLDHFGSLYNLKESARKKNIAKLLKMIGLESEKDKLAQELSGGMEKRLGIACSLVHSPDVLILDEPTANLDPVLREETWKLIKNIHKSGTTVIVASHLLEELEPVCQRIGILHNSSLIEVGTPDQLKGRYSKNEEIRLITSGKHDQIQKQMKQERYVKRIKKQDNTLIFYTPQPVKTLYRLLHLVDDLNEKIIGLEVSKPSLKEIFESIYQK
ncbi:ABC transporter ATP-binding protein [Candidatus Woesearchaeota archaeon]|nr:ABC transporter ATP-binding protein [Candidatus Woesearchaeota archaeon]